jgi:hypothetical protein
MLIHGESGLPISYANKNVNEHKFYAPGVGNVQTVDAITGNHLDLTSFTPGP